MLPLLTGSICGSEILHNILLPQPAYLTSNLQQALNIFSHLFLQKFNIIKLINGT